MGWWSAGVMGGDIPWDIRGEFEERFGSDDPCNAAENDLPPFSLPTAEEGLAFIADVVLAWHHFPPEIIAQVTGFLMMQRAAPFSDELQSLVRRGIDTEILTMVEGGRNLAERLQALAAFRAAVDAYPAEGGNVALPLQSGLGC